MKFQLIMGCLLSKCKGSHLVYFDDILIYSYNEQKNEMKKYSPCK